MDTIRQQNMHFTIFKKLRSAHFLYGLAETKDLKDIFNTNLSSEVPLTPLVNSGLSSSRHQLMLWGLVFSVSRDGVHTITRPRSGWFKRYPSGRSSFKSGSPTSLQQTARDKCPWWYKLPLKKFNHLDSIQYINY